MAATKTVAQRAEVRKSGATSILLSAPYVDAPESIAPRHGVVTLFGYGIKVHVDRGHLVLEDGVGDSRRQWRFPRVGHRLQRLIIIGSDGMIRLPRCAGWLIRTLHS